MTTGQVRTGFGIMDAMENRMKMFWTTRMLAVVSGVMLVGAAAAGTPPREDATLTCAAHVAIERPKMPWLFGGFGFQNAEAQLTPLMTDEFRNERAVKSFREL